MRLRNLVQDDDAVSPVIGVILMVAITVILAAVIASFVLGLGNQAGSVAPQANFEFNFDTDADSGPAALEGTVYVTHTGGDAVRDDELIFRGDSIESNNETDWGSLPRSDSSGSSAGVSAVVSGDTADVGVTGNDYIIRLIWEDLDGDSSSQLAEDRGPDA